MRRRRSHTLTALQRTMHGHGCDAPAMGPLLLITDWSGGRTQNVWMGTAGKFTEWLFCRTDGYNPNSNPSDWLLVCRSWTGQYQSVLRMAKCKLTSRTNSFSPKNHRTTMCCTNPLCVCPSIEPNTLLTSTINLWEDYNTDFRNHHSQTNRQQIWKTKIT